ncbi:MAG TPA: hypothetical protein VKB73_14300 [Gaiellaceae bacterium]|jgi:hypothetical protein|nr:hypothetical protein [Gaiellaceae bacterium]
MATRNGRSAEDVRQDIESERERLATAVEDLRTGIGEATDIRRMLQGKVPVVTAAALGAGFVLAGGIGATMRLIMRRSREGHTRARLGHFSLVDRD